MECYCDDSRRPKRKDESNGNNINSGVIMCRNILRGNFVSRSLSCLLGKVQQANLLRKYPFTRCFLLQWLWAFADLISLRRFSRSITNWDFLTPSIPRESRFDEIRYANTKSSKFPSFHPKTCSLMQHQHQSINVCVCQTKSRINDDDDFWINTYAMKFKGRRRVETCCILSSNLMLNHWKFELKSVLVEIVFYEISVLNSLLERSPGNDILELSLIKTPRLTIATIGEFAENFSTIHLNQKTIKL